MSVFKKKETSSPPKAPGQALSMEPHASSPAPDAAAVIGGLGWYRTQFHRAMKLALGLSLALMVSLAVIALLLLNQPKPRYFAAAYPERAADVGVGHHYRGHVAQLSGVARKTGSRQTEFR